MREGAGSLRRKERRVVSQGPWESGLGNGANAGTAPLRPNAISLRGGRRWAQLLILRIWPNEGGGQEACPGDAATSFHSRPSTKAFLSLHHSRWHLLYVNGTAIAFPDSFWWSGQMHSNLIKTGANWSRNNNNEDQTLGTSSHLRSTPYACIGRRLCSPDRPATP